MTLPPMPSLRQLRLREHQLFLALTVVVGIVAGLSAVLFSVAIDWTTRVFFGLAPSSGRLFLTPVVVSLVTGFLLVKVFPDARGSGVPQTKAAVHLHGGEIAARVPIGKFLTGVLCISSGHSMGREGPSVQIGAGIASTIGRWLRLPPERLRDLVPVGAAGALAAAFNTPVAAVLFTLEEILGDLNASLLGSTVIASVASVVVERSILGNEPLFRVPIYHLEHPAELLAYAGLGVVGGILSLLFSQALLRSRALFKRLPASTRMLQPAMGGAVIGLLIILSPAVMGVGYEYVDRALNGGLVLNTLLFLCGLKMIATIVSYSSGNAGGIFAPSLYIGAMAGGALGTLVHRFAPFPTAEPGAYALVGMGTLFAGIIRAPMTSVFMIFEITQDYQILVPLMVANLLSFIIARRFQPEPVYHALLQQDGIHLPAAPAAGADGWTAQEVMSPAPSPVPAEASIRSVLDHPRTAGTLAVLVARGDGMPGVVTHARLAQAAVAGHQDDAVGSLVEGEPLHVHPDHAADVVLERITSGGGWLPVVSRGDARRVIGLVTFEGIARAMRRRRS
ncbi:MAG: chloride channel protein [Vicinamibacterales bacterium]